MKGFLISIFICFIAILPSGTAEKASNIASEELANKIDTLKEYNKVMGDSLTKMRQGRKVLGVSIHRKLSMAENKLNNL